MYELIQRWRGSSMYHTITLREAANEVEKAWHEDQHNAAWAPDDCRICIEEMKAEGNG